MQHPPNTGNLAGQRVFISRPATDARDFITPLAAAGAHVLAAPLIETAPVPFEPPAADAYDWIFVTSRHGARCGLPGLDRAKPVAAVGPATAEAVQAQGFEVSFLPESFDAAGVARAFLKAYEGIPLRLLWLCGNLANREPAAMLEAGGMRVRPMEVYETRPVSALAPEMAERLQAGVDVLAFTSPSSVRSFHELGFPTGQAAIVCMGPATAEAARQVLGRCDRVAAVHTLAGLSDAVIGVNTPA